MFFVDFLLFRRMVTDKLVVVLYPIGSVLIFFASLWTVYQGYQWTVYQGYPLWPLGWAVVGAIVYLVVGNLVWRVFCETVVVLFAIHERLREIRDRAGRTEGG